MSDTTQPLIGLSSEQGDTRAGNYFVSNYPPFSYWGSKHVELAQDRFKRSGTPDTTLGVYVHIPFCRKRCHFCYFRVYTEKNSREIVDYLDAVGAEASRLAETAFVKGRKIRFLYFGGGTPSYLSRAQLNNLASHLRQAFPWDEIEEIAFECEPGTLTEKKVRGLRELGVTRLSLGIENFSDEILAVNNRAHRSMEIYRAYDWIRAAEFPQVNIDLIAGMIGETDKNWGQAVKRTIELGPDAVTIYQMEVPHNTTIYREMRKGGRDSAPVADWKTKRRWVTEAFEALESAGYTIGSAYTAVKDSKKTKFVYRDSLWAGADMLAVGVSSFGHIDGVHYQNEIHIEPYTKSVLGGQLPVWRAIDMTPEEKMIRQFILQMKLGRLSTHVFRERFGVDIEQRWKLVFREYEQSGWLVHRNGIIELTREGLMQVDRLLHAFFLPQHQVV